jgi:AcrR family transcriptional regulator
VRRPRRRNTALKRPRRKPPRVDVAGVRREQIVAAAAAVIAEEGIQNLSLSAIESRTGMSRGQLTYYFPAKEEILLAVFDRTVRQMRDRVDAAGAPCGGHRNGGAAAMIRHVLENVIGRPAPADFTSLQFTFLAQMGHRKDFRQRLASLYEHWRTHMAEGLSKQLRDPAADPRTMASFVQAVIHGVVIQLEADPGAFDRGAMLALCLAVLGRQVPGLTPTDRPITDDRTEGNHHA